MDGIPREKRIARESLASLIADFEAMRGAEHGKEHSEKTVRSWVEKFLEIFGWDPRDPRQVVQEYSIQGREARRLAREGSHHRRPDYTLKIGGQRILYIDVKQFEVNLLEDSSVAYQVRSYGWSAGMRLSYAFDFEELAVYDCRIKPDPADPANKARALYLHSKEYVEEFDRLSEYFSREAIASGSLSRLHPDDERPKGSLPLDRDFEEKLSAWRRDLAKTILRYGHTRDPAVLSGASQRILDRIVFLRLCEEIGLEELGILLKMALDPDGFWPLFMEEHEKRYRKVYDGILFPRSEEEDPTGIEHHILQWWLKGRVFRDIVKELYYPSPYRFNVIPLDLLGGIYEKYLGKRLRVVGADVRDEYKPEYQRTQGTVYTPAWVVERVVENTLSPVCEGLDPERLLALRIVDPACGSGSFLLGVYEFLERRVLDWFAEHPRDRRKGEMVSGSEAEPRLRPAIARSIIEGCLHGVDIDAQAVEVARMSLALRYLDRTSLDQADQPEELLAGIGANIKQGNSLAGPDFAGLGFKPDEVRDVMPFDWKHPERGFGRVFSEKGGFDAVVGNPPYIEVKRYKEWMPALYRYLKEGGVYETTAQGKTDLAMPFIERSVHLLRPGGRMGFIVQNRFFRTEYGEIVRRWLRTGERIEAIEDFRDLQIFPGRTTYTAILTIAPGTKVFRYRGYADLAAAQAAKPCVDRRIRTADIDDGVWSFDQPDLEELHKALAARHGTIGRHREISISVGLQTLYGNVYQIQPAQAGKIVVKGVNGEGEEATLERKALRPLCRNRGFYPFRRNNADAWVIFPYDVTDVDFREIPWSEFEERFPKTAEYLEIRKAKIKAAVETEKGAERWHLYTRPQNLVAQARAKVLFPSTVEDAIVAVDQEGDVYQDNVRVNSMAVNGFDGEKLMLVAAIMNSSLFNALAKVKAGMSAAGWRQLNKQFLSLVPFPLRKLKDGPAVEGLFKIALRIQELQESFHKAKGEGQRQAMKASLADLWEQLDAAVEDLYELAPDEKAVARRYPRKVDRVELLTRQAEAPEED